LFHTEKQSTSFNERWSLSELTVIYAGHDGGANILAICSFTRTSQAVKSAIMKAHNPKHQHFTVLQMVHTEWSTMSQSKIKRVQLTGRQQTKLQIKDNISGCAQIIVRIQRQLHMKLEF